MSQHWVEDTTCWWNLQLETAGDFVQVDTAEIEETLKLYEDKEYTDVNGEWPRLCLPYAPPIQKNVKQSRRTRMALIARETMPSVPPRRDTIGSPVTGPKNSTGKTSASGKVRRTLGDNTGSTTAKGKSKNTPSSTKQKRPRDIPGPEKGSSKRSKSDDRKGKRPHPKNKNKGNTKDKKLKNNS